MEDLNISQLPVIDQSGQSVGRLTERYLLEVTDLTTDVRQHMRTPFPEIPADAPATLARDLLDTNEAVLITPGQTNLSKTEDNPYVGVLTPADFARIEQL
jgi:predicted transcriptional regulator